MPKVAIIGAGAAGCFCAVNLSRMLPGTQIDIYERNVRPLMKLALTGGGRCNITNTFEGVSKLRDVYPRGDRFMKRALNDFGSRDTREWFRAAGVETVVEDAGRVFPQSQDAMQVVRSLLYAMKQQGVRTHCNHIVRDLSEFKDCDAVILTSGGGAIGMIEDTGIETVTCVPSLFGLTVSDALDLNGVSAPEVAVSLSGTGFHAEGALVITHGGFSGPAVLKLSSHAARHLHENRYRANLSINWMNISEQQCRELIRDLVGDTPAKLLRSVHPTALPSALWQNLMERSRLRADIRCSELGSKGMNRLVSLLGNDIYHIVGKSPHKEEFVTCGGVSLSEVSFETLESKTHPRLFFAGEVLDIDALTGGYNLQAAWTTAYVAARGVAQTLR